MPARKTKSASRRRPALTGSIIKIRITLLDTQPPVWREVVLKCDTPLDDFMHIVMAAMGWGDCHLHEMTHGHDRYRLPDMILDDFMDDGILDASKVRVEEVLPRKGAKCLWTYDFGDSWEHEIKVVETDVMWEEKLPACTDGARACPPEDCGGIPGYWNLCDAMNDPNHPERESLLEWLGESFDPNDFDLAKSNCRL